MDNYKYLQIVDWVKERIVSENLKPNDRFLTEKQLCEIHGVSRQTVRQALMKLESENVLVRVRGSGTFVGGRADVPATAAAKGSVGVVSTYFSDYIFPHIVTGIEKVLNDSGCTMQLATTHNMVSEERQALEGMLAGGVQGLIVEPSKSALPNPNRELYDKLRQSNIPVVFFNARYPWSDLPYVAMDDKAAGRTVTDYLFDCGHRDIAGLFALDDIQGHLRYEGFMESNLAHGVNDSEKNVYWFAASERGAITNCMKERLFELFKNKTAVVCYNDKLAVKILGLCRENGIKVPEKLSVAGIDDSRYAAICEVPLTTVHHPHGLLGEAAAQTILDMIGSRSMIAENKIFKPELIIRNSVVKL